MQRVGAAVVLIVIFGSLATAMQDPNFSLHVQSLFRSNAKSQFSSEKDYVKQHTVFLKQFQNLKFKTEGEIHFKTLHPVVIKLQSECGTGACHQNLESQLSFKKVSFINEFNALIYSSSEEIHNLQKSNPDIIQKYSPIMPEMKVDSSLRSLCDKSIDKRRGGVNGDFLKLRIDLIPLTFEEISNFKTFLTGLSEVILSSLDTSILDHGAHSHGILEKQKYSLLFTFDEKDFHSLESHSIILSLKSLSGGKLYEGSNDCFMIEKVSDYLSQRREVQWIERDFEMFHHNRFAKGVCQTGDTKNANIYSAPGGNLTGVGEIVGIADTGIDFTNCYFHDPQYAAPFNRVNYKHRKVVSYTTFADRFDDEEGHGTHVSGTVAGYSIFDYGDPKLYNGMAYDAKIHFYDIGRTGQNSLLIPGNLAKDLFGTMYATGARIFSNSWGSVDNSYSGSSRSVDLFMYMYPDSCILFAAGNNGTIYNTYDPDYNTVGSPSTCKNCVTVGASLNAHLMWKAFQGNDNFNQNQLSDFSSKGPTADGRLKPDITAPGWWTASAGSGKTVCGNSSCPVGLNGTIHCTLKIFRGTSMATPTVAGHAVLIRQYFTQGFYPSGAPKPEDSFIPSGALIKALLINSGRSLNYIVSAESDSTGKTSVSNLLAVSGYPSTEQGYGRIQLDHALNFGKSEGETLTLFVRGAAWNHTKNGPGGSYYVELNSTHLSQNYTFEIKTVTNVRATLVWTDPPGVAGGNNQNVMVNRLTMSVYQHNSKNVYVPYSETSSSGKSIFSDTGPVKVVDMPMQSKGVYTVVVKATSLSTFSQSYAIVITGDLVGLNYTEEVLSSTVDIAATELSRSSIDLIIFLSIAAFILSLIMATIYYNDRVTRKNFLINHQRRSTAARSRSNSNVSQTEPKMRSRRNSNAPGSRRPSVKSTNARRLSNISPPNSRPGSRPGSRPNSRPNSQPNSRSGSPKQSQRQSQRSERSPSQSRPSQSRPGNRSGHSSPARRSVSSASDLWEDDSHLRF